MAKETLNAKFQRYQMELSRSQQFRTKEAYDDLWHRMIDLYRGKHYDEATMSKGDRLIVNMAFATKNVIAPSVAVNNPRFTVLARKPDEAPQSVVTQEVLNYLWRTHHYHRQFRLAVDDSLTIGHGWIKVGYKFVKKPVEAPLEDDESADETGEGDAPGIDDREAKAGNVETEMKVVDDRPFIQRISPFDMYVDPDARCPEELRWIAQRVRRPINDVKVDKRYDVAARKKATAGEWKRHTLSDNPHDASNSVGYCDVIEFFDIKANKVSTFVANGGTVEGDDGAFLRKPEEMPYSFGNPFVMVRNYEVPDYFYPMGELEQMESLQLELNETRTQQMNHRKRNVVKYIYDETRFDEKGIEALKSDVHNTMVPVSGAQGVQDALGPMPAIMMTADQYNMSDIVAGDINTVTATSDYMRGNSPDIRRTATEAAMIQDSQNARAADKLAAIEGVLAQIGSRVVQLMQQYLTGDHVARIVGSNAMPMWVNYDKHYIKGEFDFEVEGGSTQPRNESFRRQSALQLMDAMGPFMQMGVVDPMALARRVLMDFGIKDADAMLAQQQEADPGMGGMPAGPPPPGPPQPPEGMPPEVMAEQPPESEDALIAGIPNHLISQLAGQEGLPV